MEHTLAISRKFLEGMGLEEKQVESIIEANAASIEGIKADRDRYKEQAEKVPDLQKQLEDAKKATEGGNDWQAKYDEEHQAFEEYKLQVTAEKKAADMASAYRKQVLEKAGIAAQYVDDVMGVTKLDGIEIDDDGSIKDADKLVEAAKQKWGSFVVKKRTETDNPATPPSNGGTAAGGDPEIAKRMQERNERMFGTTKAKE